ncbi:MAG: hypothetical protein AAFW46_00655 [Pseudomonadota bacterium]
MELPAKGVNRPDPAAFGRGLAEGLGVNLLVRDVEAAARFQARAFAAQVVYFDDDFAILRGSGAEWMLHSDRSYRNNALIGIVRGSDDAGGVRGAGCELRLYGSDPDAVVARAKAMIAEGAQAVVLAEAMDKPHGQREAAIVDPEGYVWVPGRPI